MAAENRQRAADEAEKAAAAAAEAAERHKAAAIQVKATATVLTAAAKFRRILQKGKSLTDDIDKQVGLFEPLLKSSIVAKCSLTCPDQMALSGLS